MPTRRQFLTAALATAGLPVFRPVVGWAQTAAAEIRTRAIPATGENLPVVGMGTSGSFQVSPGSEAYRRLPKVLSLFFEGGGRCIDTAPTYGNAEDVLGDLLTADQRGLVFLATKLSRVNGRDEGRAQFADTLKRLKMNKVDLLQVHNLGDWRTQIRVARELKEEGKIRYVGFTHYVDGAQDELADVIEMEKPDFLQINHSVVSTKAEERLFPIAEEHGIAVLTNRNFDDGRVFDKVRDKPLPGWAPEVGANSWAQLFLKYSLSHPAVTAVIPATGKPKHQADNMQAGYGPLLDAAQRRELVEAVA